MSVCTEECRLSALNAKCDRLVEENERLKAELDLLKQTLKRSTSLNRKEIERLCR